MSKEKLNHKYLLIAGAILLGLLIVSFNNSNLKNSTTLSAEGLAEMKVEPDKVTIYVLVSTTDKSAEVAKTSNDLKAEAIFNSLKTIGIDNSFIETDHYSVNPNYDYRYGTREITGYTASNSFRINLKDFDLLGNVADLVVGSSGFINHINFELSKEKEDEFKLELLEKATINARAKAEAIASGLNKRIVDVESVSTNDFSYFPSPIYRAEAGGDLEEVAVNLAPKKLELSAAVSVTFLIK